MSDEFNENLNQNNNGATGQTGNGNYQYHSSYSTGYQSNGSGSSYQAGGNGSYDPNGNGGKKRGGKKHGGMAVIAVLLAAAVGVAGGFYARDLTQGEAPAKTEESAASGSTEENKSLAEASENASDSSESNGTQKKASDELKTTTGSAVVTDVTQVVEDVMPSVVSVYNNFTQTTQDFFGQTYAQEGTSTGSGIIIAKDEDNGELLIATNNHVVEDADSLEVQFIDESTAEAKIKGTDAGNDLAVIAVKLKDVDSDTMNQIEVATLGDSDELKIGEPVVAIGNALGYGQSVTTGVVSALERELQVENVSGTFIQTDAAINPGNSGGPLVDLNGNVIGINSSKIGGEKVDSMGFAIPMSTVEEIVNELIANGKVVGRPAIGISGYDVDEDTARYYDVPQGVLISSVDEASDAYKQGVQANDIIIKVNGKKITCMSDINEIKEGYSAGDEMTLTVYRSGKTKDIKITLMDESDLDSSQGSSQQSEEPQQDGGYGYGYGYGTNPFGGYGY